MSVACAPDGASHTRQAFRALRTAGNRQIPGNLRALYLGRADVPEAGVLLSIIMVGQSVQSAASDARAAKQFADTETILDRLDVNTAGGIKDVLDAIQTIANAAGAPQTRPSPPRQSNRSEVRTAW